MVELIYDGALSGETARSIEKMLHKYPYVVEVERPKLDWDAFMHWNRTECPKYTVGQEDCMGKPFTVERTLFATVYKNFLGDRRELFLFFKSLDEKEAFIAKFPDCLINTEPFKTKIDGPSKSKWWF